MHNKNKKRLTYQRNKSYEKTNNLRKDKKMDIIDGDWDCENPENETYENLENQAKEVTTKQEKLSALDVFCNEAKKTERLPIGKPSKNSDAVKRAQL